MGHSKDDRKVKHLKFLNVIKIETASYQKIPPPLPLPKGGINRIISNRNRPFDKLRVTGHGELVEPSPASGVLTKTFAFINNFPSLEKRGEGRFFQDKFYFKTVKTFALFLGLLAASVVSSGDMVRVSTKENSIRADCRFFAPVKAGVKYGDRLEVLSKEGDWYRVTFAGVKGCIHEGAVSDKNINLSGLENTQGRGARSDEVALAGKGFNPQVESSYRNKHPDLDYGKVNSIERLGASDEEVRTFIREGGLTEP